VRAARRGCQGQSADASIHGTVEEQGPRRGRKPAAF
jgi:hypothetical protein